MFTKIKFNGAILQPKLRISKYFHIREKCLRKIYATYFHGRMETGIHYLNYQQINKMTIKSCHIVFRQDNYRQIKRSIKTLYLS